MYNEVSWSNMVLIRGSMAPGGDAYVVRLLIYSWQPSYCWFRYFFFSLSLYFSFFLTLFLWLSTGLLLLFHYEKIMVVLIRPHWLSELLTVRLKWKIKLNLIVYAHPRTSGMDQWGFKVIVYRGQLSLSNCSEEKRREKEERWMGGERNTLL